MSSVFAQGTGAQAFCSAEQRRTTHLAHGAAFTGRPLLPVHVQLPRRVRSIEKPQAIAAKPAPVEAPVKSSKVATSKADLSPEVAADLCTSYPFFAFHCSLFLTLTLMLFGRIMWLLR